MVIRRHLSELRLPRGATAAEAARGAIGGPLASKAVAAGLLPATIILFLIAGAMWGSGEQLLHVSDRLSDDDGTTGGRDAAAWISVVLFLLLIAAGLLGPLSKAVRNQGSESALRTARERVEQRYGLNLDVVWPVLREVLPPGASRVLATKAARADTAAAVCAGWALAGVFGVVLVAIADWQTLLVVLVVCAWVLFFGVAHGELRAAARDLWAARERALDLNRFELMKGSRLLTAVDRRARQGHGVGSLKS